MYKFLDEKKQHLHTLRDKALKGCTTVCGIIAKTLTWWASGMAVQKFGWLDPKKNSPEDVQKALEEGFNRVKALDLAGYKKLLAGAYKAHSEKLGDSAEVGTLRHKNLEKYVKLMISDQGGKPHLMNSYDDSAVEWFANWATNNVKRFLWSEVHGYSEDMWTGVILDVGWLDMQDRIIAGDFKSAPVAYFNNFVQIAGGDLMLSENGGFTADGEKILTLIRRIDGYCIIPFGKLIPEPEFIYDVEAYKNGFKYANGLYDLQQSYKTTPQ